MEVEHLEQALDEHGRSQVPLGQVLVARGWLDEDTLAEAIACQADLPRAQVTGEVVQAHATRLPAEVAARLRVVCVGEGEQGQPVVATAVPLAEAALAEVAQHLGGEPLQQIARDSEIDEALHLVFAAAAAEEPAARMPLIEVLADEGLVDRAAYEDSLRDYRPEEHGSVAELLVERGVMLATAMQEAAGLARVGA